MDHPSRAELMAYLDEELSGSVRSRVSGHLQACEACAGRLESLRAASRRLSGALERIDRPPPPGALASLRERSGIPEFGNASGTKGAGRSRRSLLQAAVLLLALAGVASAAIPGSPVRDWVARSLDRTASFLARDSDPADTAVADDEEQQAVAADGAGVTVRLADGGARILVSDPAPGTMIRIRLVRGDLISVRAANARFRTGPGRIEVVEGGPGELRIELPRAARSALVTVNERPAVVKEGPDLRFLTEVADSSAAEFLFRAER